MCRLAEISVFPSPELPPHLKCQVLSFIRVEWWWVFQGAYLFWDYTQKDTQPVNVIIHERNTVISHAEVNRRSIAHEQQTYLCYGLSAVFTYPSFRNTGYGKQAVRAATDYIKESDADIAMLFCLPPLRAFYEECGWTAMPDTAILSGDPAQPARDDEEILLMLFVSEKGRRDKSRFEKTGVYVGTHTW